MNKVKSFQEILSIGYIYLIAIGVLSETFYYKQIGVDILKYSGILDVLISPLVRLTSSFISIILISILVILFFKLPDFFIKRRHKKWVKKSIKIDESIPDDEAKASLLTSFMFILALSLFGFFIGTGIGSGARLSQKIEKGELSYIDQIEFTDGKKVDVKIVGINSVYLFYLEKDTKTVKITPIGSVVKSIENK